jgi:hypothetical protein
MIHSTSQPQNIHVAGGSSDQNIRAHVELLMTDVKVLLQVRVKVLLTSCQSVVAEFVCFLVARHQYK